MPSGRQTTNYLDLILPKGSEYYSVQDGNLNFTILDSKIEEIVNNISSLNDNMESSIEQAVSDIIGGSTEGIDSLKDILDLLNDPESGELVKINEAINQRVTNDEFSEFKTEHTKVHDTLNTRLSNIDDGSNGLIVKEQTARQSADIELTNKISSKADKKNDNGGFAGGYNASATNGGAIGDNAFEDEGGFAGGYRASATDGGGAIGDNVNAIAGGGAVGSGAHTNNGGFAGGANASAGAGGAVGYGASENNGGFAGGANASATSGGAVGANADATTGGAIGISAFTTSGGAVGCFTKTEKGFAGGYNAQTINGDDPIDAIQLGTGTNSIEKTLQVYNYQLMDASGNVPSARLTQAVNSAGSDYAEMLEWSDGNLNNEDRRGLFIAYDDSNPDKIKIANKDDEIIGVTSSIPTVIGNSCNDNWKCKYKTDVFGKPLTQIVHHDAEYIEIDVKDIDENGNKLKTTHKEQKLIHSEYDSEEYIINPKYDSAQEYIPRLKRKEWAVIGMIGQLIMIDDGTCIPGKKCVCGENGIATLSENNSGFRVLSRIDDTHIKVFIK